MDQWAVLMVIVAGVWAFGVTAFSLVRVPRLWRADMAPAWRADFTRAVRRVDRVQPLLLIATLVLTTVFALGASGVAGILAVAGLAGFVAILVGSVSVLVPLQRRLMIDADRDDAGRSRWMIGHLARAVGGLAAFSLVTLAALY